MGKFKLIFFVAGFVAFTFLASCRKNNMAPNAIGLQAYHNGIYILNQGDGYGSNIAYNSTLTFYNSTSKALIPDLYSIANGAKIGAIGNDVEIYGSKMYLIATISSVVDIIDPKTSRLIKQDSIIADNYVVQPPLYWHLREPRSIAFYKGNAFITCYDGTVAVMDTTTLAIKKYIAVGRFPEGLVVANDKIYVANSGAGLDNTVSVIDPVTLTEVKKITVIPNPVNVLADAAGNVYVSSQYDAIFTDNGKQAYPYPPTSGGISVIDTKTDLVKSQMPMRLADNVPITLQGDFLYFATPDSKIVVYNVKTQSLFSSNFIADGTSITHPFAITVSPVTGEAFVTDAKDYISNGSLYVFDKTGKLEYTVTTGINPGRIALLNK